MEGVATSGGEMDRNMAAVSQLSMDVAVGQCALPFSRGGMGYGAEPRSIRPHGRKYNSYTPEMRIRIAKYAMMAGDLEAAQHFSRELGHKVAVTSAWRFRKAYMRELKRLHQEGAQGGLALPSSSLYGDRRRSSFRRSLKSRSMIETPLILAGQEEQMDAGLDYEWTPPTEAEMKVIQAKKERSDKISKLMGDYLLKGYRMLATTCPLCGTILLRDKQLKDYCVACSELDTEHAKDDPALSVEAARSQVREHELVRSPPPTSSLSNPPNVAMQHSPGQNMTITNVHTVANGRLGAGADPGNGSMSAISHTPSPLPPTAANPHQATVLPQTIGGAMNLTQHQYYQQQQLPPLGGRVPPCQGGTRNVRVSRVTGQSLEALLDKMTWASEELKKSDALETSTQLCRLIQACAEAVDSLKNLAQM